MPEGPEVRVYADWLRIQLVGKYITSITLCGYNRTNKDELSRVGASKVVAVTSSGKKIFILTEHYVLQSTLAMTGKWMYVPNGFQKLYFNLYEQTSYGNIIHHPLHYCDKLGMGWLHVYTYPEFNQKRQAMPPCLLEDNVTYETFRHRILWDKPLYMILNDPTIIGGIGNYLRAEILYAARIRPDRIATSLTEQQLRLLYDVTMYIVRKSYECGGCALSDYEHPEGVEKSSYHQYLKVYGCKTGISTDGYRVEITVFPGDPNKQNMYWCPDIQH